MTPHPTAATLGQLRESGYRYRSVKEELRENVMARLRTGEPLFPGIEGYGDTVIPQIVHALLSRHDLLLLGLRGQAKTRLVRMMPALLDEWVPVLAEVEMPDDPLRPMTVMGRRHVAERGDDAPVRWLHRDERYHEKLATPDVTVADLIGEVDIIKVAQGRHLADESTMHLGLIPRTNRGVFAINELPDLAPRIQVSLFNVLEERDVQVRGYPIRLNLDLCLLFTANPEDYTHRGRIVTPLKDRIGSVVRTHYPTDLEQAMAITRHNAFTQRGSGVSVDVPRFMAQLVERVIQLARSSPHVSQASGVSVRTSIACLETLVSSAERRGLLTGETAVVARMADLHHLTAATRGKVELMLAGDDGQSGEDALMMSLIGEAVKEAFEDIATVKPYEPVIEAFEQGLTLTLSDETSTPELVQSLQLVPGLWEAAEGIAAKLGLDPAQPAHVALAGEFLLESLYVSNRLTRSTAAGRVGYQR